MNLGTEYTDAPVCPHCGHERHDAWEIDFGSGTGNTAEIWCSNCDEPYEVSRHCEVTYCTAKLRPKS